MLQAFGLSIRARTGVPLAGLGTAPEVSQRTMPRCDVRLCRAGDMPAPVASAVRVRTHRDGDRTTFTVDRDGGGHYHLGAPGYGQAWVRGDGGAVCCVGAADDLRLEILLIGQVLPLAATLAGLELLHASGVVLGGKAMVLAADPGVGKTSIAAQLVLRGAALLSDDAVAVDAELQAHPGGLALSLRATEAELVDVAGSTGWSAVGDVDDRRRLRAPGADAAPLRAILLLDRLASDPVLRTDASPDPFALLGATFNVSVRDPDRLRRQLDLCARLASEVEVIRVSIRDGLSAGRLADLLLDRWGAR